MNSMYIALGYQCNHRCYFCPCGNNPIKTPAASTEELIHAIRAGIEERNIDYITISGGEPTLHPGFHDILLFCAENGIKIGILSNGDTFSKMKNVEMLLNGLNNASIQVTTALHSDVPELHDRVTCSNGSFARSVNGILNLIEFGIPVIVKQVVSKWNYERLRQFVDFCYGKFGPKTSMTICGMDFCGMKPEDVSVVAIDYNSIGKHLEKALDLVLSLRKQFNAFPHFSVTDLPLCCVDPYYWGFFTRVSRNRISQYSAPGSNEGDVSSSYTVLNDCDVFFKACKECCVNEICPGVWRTAYDYFGEGSATSIIPVK